MIWTITHTKARNKDINLFLVLVGAHDGRGQILTRVYPLRFPPKKEVFLKPKKHLYAKCKKVGVLFRRKSAQVSSMRGLYLHDEMGVKCCLRQSHMVLVGVGVVWGE